MMGSESDPKDGKVVAGSIFWAVLVYAVRLSFFLLVAANPQPGLLSPCLPPTQHARSGGGGKKKKWKKKTRSNSEGVGIRFSSFFVVFKQFYITERVSGGLYR